MKTPSEKCPNCGGVVRFIPIQVRVGATDCYDYKKQKQCVSCDYIGESIPLTIEDYKIWGAGEE